MPYLILDTNILLLDANNLLTLGKDYTIVLPETVLDEIDAKKTSLDPEIRYQVRQFGRLRSKTTDIQVKKDSRKNILISRNLNDIRLITVILDEYTRVDAEPNIRNDNKIIDVAEWMTKHYDDVTFMTNDGMCAERALARGIKTTDLKIVDNDTLEFTKEITVSSEVFPKLHYSAILEIDETYKVENYNYIFKDEYTGQTKLGNIRNGYIDIIGKDTEQELKRQDISPKNAGQLFLSRAIQNPNIEVVLCEASAGTGKTLTAFSNAIQLIKKQNYSEILYIRNSVDDVERAEESGFRSGNDEKDAPYFGPVDDTLDTILRNRYKASKLTGQAYEDFITEKIEEMKIRFNIVTTTTLGLRGRTIKEGTIVIYDEAQNGSANSTQKILTRFGKGTKAIIIGSNKQIDHPYITKHNNGLSVLLNGATKEQDLITQYAIQLTKVLRSPLAEYAERLFSKEK